MRKVTKQVMAVGIAIALAATSVPMSTQTVSAAKKTAAKKVGKKSTKNSAFFGNCLSFFDSRIIYVIGCKIAIIFVT